MAGSSIFVDTNILLAASDRSRTHHEAARRLFHEWPNRGVLLLVSGQIFREYLVVATRPHAANGLGLSTGDGLANAAAFGKRLTVLDEDRRVARQLRELLEQAPCAGRAIHDANVVATMLRHGVLRLLTANPRDFVRFSDYIEVQTIDSIE